MKFWKNPFCWVCLIPDKNNRGGVTTSCMSVPWHFRIPREMKKIKRWPELQFENDQCSLLGSCLNKRVSKWGDEGTCLLYVGYDQCKSISTIYSLNLHTLCSVAWYKANFDWPHNILPVFALKKKKLEHEHLSDNFFWYPLYRECKKIFYSVHGIV